MPLLSNTVGTSAFLSTTTLDHLITKDPFQGYISSRVPLVIPLLPLRLLTTEATRAWQTCSNIEPTSNLKALNSCITGSMMR